jgi:hypothetical protein
LAATLPDYIAQLDGMRAALHEHRLADAQAQARALKGTTIDTPAGRIAADPSLVDDVLAGRIGSEARLAIAVDALRKATRKAAPTAPPPTDRKLLERLRREETPDALKAGGEVAQPPVSNQPVIVRILDAIDKMFDWIGEKLSKLWEWLRQLWPRADTARGGGASVLRTRWVVGALVVAILAVIGILAWEVIRKSKRNVGTPVTESDPVASKRDEDPMSRGANEWERYAAQLAAAGRIREAIRAWYHAVLVTCYGAGILHYRKGRTNWEYIGALSPELAWRGDFVSLTRRFETEWYGRTTSSRDALDECSARAERVLEGVHRSAGRGAAA